jgi:hypothetical protein
MVSLHVFPEEISNIFSKCIILRILTGVASKISKGFNSSGKEVIGMVGVENAMNIENETQNPMLPFAGEAAFQKAAWAVGKIYVVRCISSRPPHQRAI